MAPSPALRFLLHHSRPSSSRATVSSIFPKLSIPVHSTLSVRFSSFPNPTSPTTQVTHKEENDMVYIEERLGNKSDRSAESVVNSSTIATIVTSLSGSPATVGIVRLSCPSAVSIIGRVFRSASKEKRRDDRRPTSHVVEYENEMVYIEERLGNKSDRSAESVVNSSTIAAIVTSLSGPPAAVGIVRLSGPSAVSILGRVFRSASKEKRRHDWRLTSHVVEYGVLELY